MSVPAGFVEIVDSPEMRQLFPMLGTNSCPCFVRMVPVRRSQRLLYDWITRRPAWVLYAGPVEAWQAPLVLEITRVAIAANSDWSLPQVCSTWGAVGSICRQDSWELISELAPVVPNNVKGAWPHTNALWSWEYETQQPARHALQKKWGSSPEYVWVSASSGSASA
jgi:hypothetical protein